MSDESQVEWSNVKSLHKDRFVESKKPYFDLKNLHLEAQKRLQILGLVTTNIDGELQEATEEEIDAILRKTVQNEDPDVLADKYMMEHGLYELFKTMTTKVVLNRPTDPIGFMVNDLEKQAQNQSKP